MMDDGSRYHALDVLSDEDEAMLRKLVSIDMSRESRIGAICRVGRDTREGTLIRHLGQANMVNVVYDNGNPCVLEVYAEGYSYIKKRDNEAEAERKRIEERKEDRAHDWHISVFTAVVGIVGVIIGFVLGEFF